MSVSRDDVVQEALALLKEEGLDALSLRKLAARLNISAPTLYWHVANKRELLDLVAERLVHAQRTVQTLVPAPGQPWWEWLRLNLREVFETLIEVRDAPRVLAGNRPGLDSLSHIDTTLGALREAGLSAGDAQQALFSLGSYVVGSAIEWQAEAERQTQGVGIDPQVVTAIHEGGYPNLTAAMRDTAERPPRATFEFGLDLLIDALRDRYATGLSAIGAQNQRVAFGLVFPIDIWALIPHPDGDAVLVTETGSGHALPFATVGSDDDTGTRLTTVTEAGNIDSPFLRRVAAVKTGERELVLKEFEPVPAAGRRWLPLDELANLDLPTELRPGLSEWAAHQRGGEFSDFRPAWSRPGWFADTRDWLDEQLTHYGIAPAGQPSVVQQWAISAVLKQPTHGHGDYYLKSVFGGPGRGFWHEPALSAALAREHPGLVPAVTTIDSERGLMLMPDMGITVVEDHPAEKWDDGPRVLAEIQRAWVGRREEVLALGCPDRDLTVTSDHLETAFADPLITGQIDDVQRIRIAGLMPRWRKLFEEATQWPVPLSLVHGDYHPGNAGLRSDDSACAFDWSDGAWSQPLLDASLYVHNSGDAKSRLWDVYLEHWTDFASLSELRQLIPAANMLRMLYGVVTYHGIMTNVDPDDRFVFASWANAHWRMALEAWDALP